MIRQGKHGPFLGCSAYPACDYIRSLTPSGRDIEKVLEGSACPDCGQPLAIKKGRYGLFVGCTQYPACQHIESLQESDDTQILCPECGKGTSSAEPPAMASSSTLATVTPLQICGE